MDRRLIGALLLVAVIAAAVVVPYIAGVRIAGSATMIDFPADPRVGDCLLEPAVTTGAAPTDVEAPAAASVQPGPVKPRGSIATGDPTRQSDPGNGLGPAFGPCDGHPVAGEVVSVMTVVGADWLRRKQVQTYADDCRSAVLATAGLVAQVDGRYLPPHQAADDPVSWRMSIDLKSGWILPSPILQGAGRTWAACVVMTPTGQLYQGRIADAYDGGRLPNGFGTCWNSRTVSAGIAPIDCAMPHLAELVSIGYVADVHDITDAVVKSSCEHLAASVIARVIPKSGGALTVKTSPERLLTVANVTTKINPSESVVCYMIPPPGRQFAGTLVGLGSNPIPYAG